MPTAEQAQRISLAFAWDGVLLLGLHALSNRRHSHAPATLLIGLDGPFQIAIGDQPTTTVEAVLLAPNTLRATESQGTRLVDLLVDPDAEACRSVRAALAGRLHCRLERQRFDAVAPEMERLFRTDCSAADATKLAGEDAFAEASAAVEPAFAAFDTKDRAAKRARASIDAKVGDEAERRERLATLRAEEAAGRAQGAALAKASVRDAQAAADRAAADAARAKSQAARAVEHAVAALTGADGAAEAERLGERLRSAGDQ